MPERTPQQVNVEILAALDVAKEYEALGVRLAGKPRASGMVSCYAFGREDRRPSAWISTKSGYYADSGNQDAAACTQSLWDFAAATGRFPDWQTARRAFAEKANIKIGRVRKLAGTDWRGKLQFQEWSTPGNGVLALRWCTKTKPGVTVAAIKAAGGQIAYYPCWFDTKAKEKKPVSNCRQVIALPCYGQWGLAADPTAWVIFDITGQPFDVSPKDHPPTAPRITAKMLSVGPTAGTTIGLSGLMTLTDPEQRAAVRWTWKAAGATDLLTLLSSVPEDQQGRHVILTNAGGETADVPPHQAALLAGLRVAIVHDRDDAGVVGQIKWARALEGIATEVRCITLPYRLKKSHGFDLRDFLLGRKDEPKAESTKEKV